jgi:hypothetical protein
MSVRLFSSRFSFTSPGTLAFGLLAAGLALLAPAVQAEPPLHEVTAEAAKAPAGGKGTLSVTLAAKNGWKLNEEAPISVKLAPGPGLTVDKPKLNRKDITQATKDKARFDVPFTAAEAGARSVDCEASYVICQESACKQVKEKLTVAVEVTPAGKLKTVKK